jgi:hypothetical protein
MCNAAIEYYFEMLKNVLEGFHLTLADLNLPTEFPEFFTLLRKSLVLEFLIVTVIKPILCLENPEKLTRWHKETVRNETRWKLKLSFCFGFCVTQIIVENGPKGTPQWVGL